MTDFILRGGEVIDGTGRPRRRADVAISGDRIEAKRCQALPHIGKIDDVRDLLLQGSDDPLRGPGGN